MRILSTPQQVLPAPSVRAPAAGAPGAAAPDGRKGSVFGPAATVSFSWERSGAPSPARPSAGAEESGRSAGSTDSVSRGEPPQDAAGPQTGAKKLDEAEQKEVKELQQRDREVRVHEQAHKSVGGAHAGAIHLDMQRGPDGASYAVGGSVPIDVSPVAGDPKATVEKMMVVRRAALAPADPSGADRQVAARATQLMSQARLELAQQSSESAGGTTKSGATERGSST